MKSYREIANETNTTIDDVREAMGNAYKRETPYVRYYDDYDNPPSPLDGPAGYGRAETAFDVMWVVLDKWQLRDVCGSGRTREDAVIDALTKGYQ